MYGFEGFADVIFWKSLNAYSTLITLSSFLKKNTTCEASADILTWFGAISTY